MVIGATKWELKEMAKQGEACQAGRAMKHKLEEEGKLNHNRLCLGDRVRL